MIYLLLQDLASNFKKDGKIYALKGEKCELIIEHGEVYILQGKKERFPVHKSKVKEI